VGAVNPIEHRRLTDNAEGIISFPSLHAALAVLFIFALWPVKWLRWIALSINLVMIAATPVDGSHYFTDIIAGLVISTLCWWAVRCALLPDGTLLATASVIAQENTGPRTVVAPSLSP